GFSFGVTAADPELDILSYTWKFNHVAFPPSDANLSSGAFIDSIKVAGDYPLEVSVSDGHNAAVTHSWTIHVTQGSTNHAPVAANDSTATTINTFTDINVLSNDSDLDGNALTVSASSLTQPSHGSTVIVGNLIRYNPANGYTGSDSFTYKATDGLLESGAATVSIIVNAVNRAPVAANDSTATTINTFTDINVLSNDSDIDGNALTVSASSLIQPSHGSAVIVGNLIRYTPATGYTGSDSFTYKATDGLLESGSATVTVTIEQSISDQIIQKSFGYFWNETDNPETGFVRDRLLVDSTPGVRTSDTRYNMASMAATGFGLAAMCVAHSDPDVRGAAITPEDIEDRVNLIMDKLLFIQGEQQNNPAKWGRDGFFYHYVNIAATETIEAGERWTESNFASEVSTIDTAILIAGALTAGDYFGGDIKDKALRIYSNVNWSAFLDTNPTVENGFVVANQYYNQMYMEWKPEYAALDGQQNPPAQDAGRRSHWDYNSEGLLIYLLAAVAPVDPAAPAGQKHNIPPETFYAIRRELGNYGKDGSGNPMVKSYFGALFTYQYTQAFFNFKDANNNALYDVQGVDWWENSVEATRANKRYCNDHAGSFANDMEMWGLTSGYVSGQTYVTYGAYPAGVVIPSKDVQGADGTVFPAAAGGSIAILPDECLRALDKMKDVYDSFLGRGVWGDYGFANSFRINTGLDNLHFISNYYCGIDMGITLVMAENNRTGLIWDHFSNFDIGGTPLKDKIVGLMEFSTDKACNVKVDDTGEKSGFRMGKLDANNPSFEVKFNLTDRQSAPYLLAIHSYMDNSLLDHTVTVTVNVNGGDPFDVDFKYLQGGKTADLMKYIPIDYRDLKPNDANVVTLQYKGIAGDSRARWLAWKNIEIASPAEHNTWTFARDVQSDVKILFGNEYRVDDTYFIGANVASFEQAVNKDVENFTDILFYTTAAEADYAALVLKVLETDKNIDTHVQVFAGGVGSPQAMIFDDPLRTGQQSTTSGYAVQSGWNRITIYHPGLSADDPLKGKWIRWDGLELIKTEPPQLTVPQDAGAAAFGNDKIKLRWKAVNYAAKYKVYRSQTPKGTYDTTPIATVTSTSYTDSSLQTGKSYYYVVKAAKENDPSGDSQNSAEVSAATGSYRLDYGDGHDPNTFAGNTLNTSDAPLADAAYFELVKYDGTVGKVRKITLNNGEKNTIELKNTNISDATIFSLRVRSDVAGAKFQMKLKDSDGGQASVSIVSPTADLWQNLLFYLGPGKQLARVDRSKIDKLEITSETDGKQIIVYLDEVDFNISTISGTTMDIRIIDGASGAQAASIDFGSTTFDAPMVLAKQYIEISNYKSTMNSWGMQIYTDNLAADANPKFTGKMPEDPADLRANGLVGTSNSGYRVPVIWQVWDHAKGYYNGTETPEYDTNGLTIDMPGNDGDRAEFAFMMDKSDGDWSKDEYSPNYRTLINSSGELGAPVPFSDDGKGYWPTTIPVGNTLYVYLAVDYTGAPAQTYTTNKLTIDIVNS
ncbi:MAG: Ig-like domain-containing protein, partial [Candidatus Omnitrophica bacterium]|nr:Ig-like domain-containing protein [Candidatus Omnitrophota bacterium]